MRYIFTHDDDTIAVCVAIPSAVKRLSDGKTFLITTVGKNEERDVTFLRGGNGEEDFVLVVGNKDFDVADLEALSIPGYEISFPDFLLDIKPKFHPEYQAKIKSHRVGKKADVPLDRTFRRAWRDKNGKVEVDMVEAKKVAKETVEREANIRMASIERSFMQLQMDGGNTAQLNALAKKNKDLKAAKDDPRLAAATTPEELKQAIEAILL